MFSFFGIIIIQQPLNHAHAHKRSFERDPKLAETACGIEREQKSGYKRKEKTGIIIPVDRAISGIKNGQTDANPAKRIDNGDGRNLQR
jgi:hypothetical protein